MTSAAYILSTYLSPPGRRAFTARRHDQNAALWLRTPERITLVRYWELERLTGRKHHEMPLSLDGAGQELIDRLIAQEGLKRADLDAVWGTPGLDAGEPLPRLSHPGLPVHSVAHLFSGLCLDWDRFHDSAIIGLALDGGPDFTLEDDAAGDDWYAGAVARGGRVELYPVESPGPLWDAAQRHFDLEHGTMMALAHATGASVDFDPGVLLKERYWGGYPMMIRCFEQVYEIIRVARRVITAGSEGPDGGFSREDLVASAVMKVVQAASIEIAKRDVDALLARAGEAPRNAYLSMTGGYALNCPTNSELINTYGFRGLLAPPCANDSGQSLGIGLMGFYARGDLRTRRVEMRLPFAGGQRVKAAAVPPRWRRRILDESGFDAEVFVRDLRAHPVAWVDGPAEIGPRALGHRSLLGDPTSAETKRVLNRVKRRQWWRPVAPIVLEEHVAEWFERGRPSPFMLETFRVSPERRQLIPAALHLDHSARIQTLSRRQDDFLYDAVAAFHRATGVPIVCNTSLNDKGEPIVDNAAEAINFCVRKGITVAYIGRRRLLLDVSAEVTEADGPEPRPLRYLYASQPSRPDAVYGDDVDAELMFLLYLHPGLHRLAESPAGSGEHELRAAVTRARRDPTFPRRARQFVEHWRNLIEGVVRDGENAAA